MSDRAEKAEKLINKIDWLLKEKALAEQHVQLQGPSALALAADRLAAANRRAFDLLPEIRAALRALATEQDHAR